MVISGLTLTFCVQLDLDTLYLCLQFTWFFGILSKNVLQDVQHVFACFIFLAYLATLRENVCLLKYS